jgi:5-hydroxyisourate hydrolase-like protein (transthyretin family)
MRFPSAVSACLALSVLASAGRAQGGGKVTVDGIVVSSSGKPIPGVAVSIMSSGKKEPVRRVVTDKNGRYMIKIKIESTYDLWYSHTRLDFAVVSHLSAGKNQHINKVLYATGEKRPVSAYQDTLQSMERGLFHVLTLGKDDRKAVVKVMEETGVVTTVGKTSLSSLVGEIPTEMRGYLEEKRRTVMTLYLKLRSKP